MSELHNGAGEFDGFGILEEAATMLLDIPDEVAFLEVCRAHLRERMLDRGAQPDEASQLADRFVEIIRRRRDEIVIAAGLNSVRTIQ
ncbi:hypothetical protein [Bradyrhizobium sp. Cp5.3]|uniref:hypothetical protein n=1 Tax=Bradyrhizobium sp. Cp5.3 TaxID=443598 RepID=UPI0004849430|nr:hypothetical protein [Bradyrhizobium sp. Cp5.3]